jgi:hypothetical protein
MVRIRRLTTVGLYINIRSSNPSCGMMLRHVISNTGLGEDYIMPAIGQSPNEHEGQTDVMHINDNASDQLLEWRATEDKPEVFKRIRFLTQWYDSEDSRSTSYIGVGQLKLWDTARSARAHRFQLLYVSSLLLTQDNIPWFNKNNDAGISISLSFVGAKRQESVPALLIYSESKHVLERALKVVRDLPWFRTGNIRIVLCSGPAIRNLVLRSTGESTADMATFSYMIPNLLQLSVQYA